MRVAVLADIHANLPALEAVLADVDARGADRIVLLGDIAGGPLPAETLDRLAGLGDRAVWVHGNGERELVDAFDGRPGEGPGAADAAECAGLIDQRHRDLMAGLPMTVTLDVDGLGPVLFCHATPRRDDEFVLVDSPVARWRAVLGGVGERLVVCGHTHMPFDRLAGGRRVVNPGSVGMAYGPAGAYWALLGDGTVQLRRTAYDATAAAARIAASAHPRAAAWAGEYVTSPYGDAEALEAFAGFTRD
ncbi:metallophosphoesterase family protein [Dactylosporangium sp. CS-047395]|uniref:metallophosphoesterase family protein n=1 Tax=Dactylosporangium sp. CS-047395 TaxID=3239936 RepID=UPI003D89E987